MRKHINILIFTLFSISAWSQNLQVNINYLLFSIPNDTNYIEFQCLTLGNSIRYTPVDEQSYQGNIMIHIRFTPIDSSKPLINNKYSIQTNKYADTIASTKENIYNVIRIPIPNGQYSLHVNIKDVASSENTALEFNETIFMDYAKESMNISDIQLISNLSFLDEIDDFSKHNIDFIPYFSNFYPENINNLTFMSEIYNTDKGLYEQDSFVYRCFISTYNSEKPLADEFLREKKCKTTDTYIMLHSLNIDSLPSGNYLLNIHIYNLDDSLLISKNLFFQRSNPDMDINRYSSDNEYVKPPIDTLYTYLDYIYVISNDEEKEFIRNAKKHSYEELDNFFTVFWNKRNPNNPLQAWYEYYKDVMMVNNSYSSLKLKGYRTDRGYVFLKYGAPSEIEKFSYTKDNYPYEIWYYYNTAHQNDIYFIFYSRDLVTNLYQLIHSTAKDEIYDPRWKLKLKAKDARPASIEDTE